MKLRILQEAEHELLEATVFYERSRVGLGVALHQQVTQLLDEIVREPNRFPIYEWNLSKRSFRRAQVNRFPYLVIFELRAEIILVVAVAHTSRLPNYWAERPLN